MPECIKSTHDVGADDLPRRLKESACEPVGPRSLVRWKRLDDLEYFRFCKPLGELGKVQA
jgi:hypothetical protein